MNPIIIRKIEELGGILRKSSSNEISEKDLNLINAKIQNIFHVELPKSYLGFKKHFGTFTFEKDVKVKLLEENSFSDKKNSVSVDCFYSINVDAEEGVFSLLEQYHDQIPFGFLPILDGLGGDFICINLKDDNYGGIYYWFHEGLVGKDTFFIAQDFDKFILSLYYEEEQVGNEDNLEDAKITLSPKLLELLRKTGHGPK